MGAHPAYETWVFEDDVVLDRGRVSAFLDGLKGSVLRLKGIVAFEEGPAIVQMVGRRWRFEPMRYSDETKATSRLIAIGLEGAMDHHAMSRMIRQAVRANKR
jgi:G3E family GTPase